MNIDIERYPKVEGKTEWYGRYFHRDKHDPSEVWSLMTIASGMEINPSHEVRGPVSFGPSSPHLDLSGVDLSKYPVVDKPDRPGVWWVKRLDYPFEYACSVDDAVLNDKSHPMVKGEFRRIGDFTPPAPALPEVPEVTIFEIVNGAGDGIWCIEKDGEYRSIFQPYVFKKPHYSPRRSRTLAAKESVGS